MTQTRINRAITVVVIAIVLFGVLAYLRSGSKVFDPSSKTSTSTIIKETSLYKPVADYESAVIEAVDSANPSVVSIVITKDLQILEQCKYDPFSDLPDTYRRFFGGFEFYQPCPGGFETREVGGGSGFIVSSDGLVITNKHVVLDDEADYTVLTNDGSKYEAKILAKDPAQDIAILKIDAIDLEPATLGSSKDLKLGQTAIAIGNALGEFRNTVSVGVVSGLSRTITASGAGFIERIENVIQTDAAINQGNSGGPLINLRGEVIGMNTAVASGAQNVGFAIQVDRIKKDIESVRATGEIKVSYLGVRYVTITADIAEDESLSTNYGAIIRGNESGPGVIPDSPADSADLRAEDIITEVDGKRVAINQSLSSIVQGYNPGDIVTLTVIRGGEAIELEVELGEHPGF